MVRRGVGRGYCAAAVEGEGRGGELSVVVGRMDGWMEGSLSGGFGDGGGGVRRYGFDT